MRLRTIAMLSATNRNFHPGYNKSACKLFDEIINRTGYNIQHALNGGEYYIEKLCYWIDGYDKENNIVYEFDEERHFSYGKLKEKDINSQISRITDVKNCRNCCCSSLVEFNQGKLHISVLPCQFRIFPVHFSSTAHPAVFITS